MAINIFGLYDINPLANITFEQIELVFHIFTSKKQVTIKLGSNNYSIFASLPISLRRTILQSKRVKFVRTKKRKREVIKSPSVEQEKKRIKTLKL